MDESESLPSPKVEPPERTARGRFAKGNTASRRGGLARRRRTSELLALIDSAIDDGNVQEVFLKLHELAVAGDVAAAQLLLGYRIGRPRERAPVVDVKLQALDTAEDLARALEVVTRAAAAGQLEPDAATALAGLLASVGDARVLRELQVRVGALEVSGAPR